MRFSAIERDKFDSVGGLIFHLTGKIPTTDDIIEGIGLQLTIIDADERKIKRVRIARIGADKTVQPDSE